MFFSFPEDARWNAERQAVEIGEYRGVVRVPRRVFQRLLTGEPDTRKMCRRLLPPSDPLRAIAERKLQNRQLTDDANVEITGRDLRERKALVSAIGGENRWPILFP